jgi:hypothetical protein
MELRKEDGEHTRRVVGAALLVGGALGFVGCGGGGGGDGLSYSAHTTIRSSALAAYQTEAALSVFPIAALEASAPKGSNLNSSVASLAKLASRRTTLTLVHHTGLYSAGATPTSDGAVFNYFTDSAGANSAGSMSLSSSTHSFSYPSYPATVNVAINVTAGYLPCQGQAQIVYQDSSGASEITGTLTLSRNQEAVTFDLLLSSSHQVTGKIQVVQNGMTFMATDLSGPFEGSQNFNFGMSPSGFSGSGTFDLTAPTLALQFNNPGGASASFDSNHHLEIYYGSQAGGGSDDDITTPIIELLLTDGTDNGDDSGNTGGTDDSTTGDSTTGDTTTGDGSTGDGCDIIVVSPSTKRTRSVIRR